MHAGMMELADMRDLGSRALRRAGPSPALRTIVNWSPSTYDNQNLIGDGMGNGSP